LNSLKISRQITKCIAIAFMSDDTFFAILVNMWGEFNRILLNYKFYLLAHTLLHLFECRNDIFWHTCSKYFRSGEIYKMYPLYS
jgi:hypothetical protein